MEGQRSCGLCPAIVRGQREYWLLLLKARRRRSTHHEARAANDEGRGQEVLHRSLVGLFYIVRVPVEAPAMTSCLSYTSKIRHRCAYFSRKI